MRRFSAEYLDRTREGMWADRTALEPLRLASRSSVLDVGCGTGELAAALGNETDARIVGADRDPDLLAYLPPDVQGVRADAYRLPFPDDSFDIVVCQALLINLPDPERALAELSRVASESVAAVEPDNSAVTVESTVASESRLAGEARNRYIAGVDTDVTLGSRLAELFEQAGLTNVQTARRDQTQTVAPPYSEADLEAVGRKARGDAIHTQRGDLAGDADALDRLRAAWREMGREALEQTQAGEYERRETVPFHVAVGDV